MRDERDTAACERADAVIHHREMQTLKIGKIARQMERENLPASADDHFVPAGETFQDHAAINRFLTLANDVAIFLIVLDAKRQTRERGQIALFNMGDRCELPDEERMLGGNWPV